MFAIEAWQFELRNTDTWRKKPATTFKYRAARERYIGMS
jgi:hypothetical protein